MYVCMCVCMYTCADVHMCVCKYNCGFILPSRMPRNYRNSFACLSRSFLSLSSLLHIFIAEKLFIYVCSPCASHLTGLMLLLSDCHQLGVCRTDIFFLSPLSSFFFLFSSSSFLFFFSIYLFFYYREIIYNFFLHPPQ